MKMRKFADKGFVREGQNENIDEDTRARAMASVNKDPLGDFIKSKGLDRGPAEAPAYGMTLADRQTPRNKPSIVSEKQLQAFKAKYGADKDLRDYMNAQAGGLKRRNTVDPNMGAKADEAFSDYRKKLEAETPPTALDVANQQRKEKLARLKLASAGAESKMRQANASSMSRADFVKGYASGGAVSASSRGDGIAQRGKTRGRMC